MNIRVDLNYPIKDGTEVVFRSPVDCSQVTGLIVYYPENGITASKWFGFADAHGNNVGDIDHLFAENVVVKVILDVTTGMAFVQNADTNAYIERTFVKSVNLQTPDKTGNVKIDTGVTDVDVIVNQGVSPDGRNYTSVEIQTTYSNGRGESTGFFINDAKDGVDGYTPVRGKDYWTLTDKAEMVNEVLAALPDGDEVAY